MRWVLIAITLMSQNVTWAESGDTSAGTDPSLLDRAWISLQGTRVSGSLRSDYFQESKEFDGRTNLYGATAQIKLLPTLGQAVDGKVEGRLIDPDIPGQTGAQGTLLEGYMTVHFADAACRVGKQIIAWGRADGVNPTDNLTPRDYTVFLPLDTDQRIGTSAAKLDYYVTQEFTVTSFLTPFFNPSRMPLPLSGIATTYTRPTPTVKNTEFAIKVDKTGGSFDWSVSYFHGFSLLPDGQPFTLTPYGPLIDFHYDRIDVLGTDFARSIGPYGFRGEVAYFQTQDRSGTDPWVKNPYFFYVIGGDRTFLENLNVNLQLLGAWVQHFRNPDTITDPVEREVAVQNAITDGQRDRLRYGMSARIKNTWLNDTFAAELLIVGDFTHTNWNIRPLLSYAFTDNLKGTLGANI
jgi:hypothetical protein